MLGLGAPLARPRLLENHRPARLLAAGGEGVSVDRAPDLDFGAGGYRAVFGFCGAVGTGGWLDVGLL